jgi:hypothetical protein
MDASRADIDRNKSDIDEMKRRLYHLENLQRHDVQMSNQQKPTASLSSQSTRRTAMRSNSRPVPSESRTRASYPKDESAPVVSKEIAARLGFPDAVASNAVKSKVTAYLRCTWQTLPGSSIFIRQGSQGAWALKEEGWEQFLADLQKVFLFEEDRGQLIAKKVQHV